MAYKKAKKKARKHASKSANAAQNSADKAQRALLELQNLIAAAGPVVTEGAREAYSRAEDLADQYTPAVADNLRKQGKRVSGLVDLVGPRAEALRDNIENDYIPRAKATANTTGNVLQAAFEAGWNELSKGQEEIRKAATKPPKKNRVRTALLVVGLAAAGGAAGYLVWKKTRPVEDPWAPPADFARAHYPASANNDSESSAVSDSVGAAEAGDVAGALKGDDRTSNTAPKEVKVDSASKRDAAEARPSHDAPSTGRRATTMGNAEIKRGSDNAGTSDVKTSGDAPRIIDPVDNPEENPQDPLGRYQEQRGNHRNDS